MRVLIIGFGHLGYRHAQGVQKYLRSSKGLLDIFDINDIKKKYYLGTYINNNIIFNSYGYDIHKWNIIYYKKS